MRKSLRHGSRKSLWNRVTCHYRKDQPRLPTAHDADCICYGNWRELVKEYQPLFGKRYRDIEGRMGDIWVLEGLMTGEDDYYYVMWNPITRATRFLSCVGDPEGHGYELIGI